MGNRESYEVRDCTGRDDHNHRNDPNRKCGCFDLKLRRQTNALWPRK